MIGFLRGVVLARPSDAQVIVDVQSVGYELTVPGRLWSRCEVGEGVEFWVHTHVREDTLTLLGFASLADRDLFRLLVATPGIGPSTAMGALSTLDASTLATAVLAGDVDTLATIPGIGKKTAARLVLELAGKLPEPEAVAAPASTGRGDLESALKGLGYGAIEIRDALQGVELPEDEASALRVALRQLGTR